MTTLIQIGNSEGMRIPKAVIEQTKLSNTEIEFEMLPEDLMLKLATQPHKGWEKEIQEIQAQYNYKADADKLAEFLSHDDNIDDWQW